MKITVITTKNGKFIGAARSHLGDQKPGGAPTARLVPGPGQVLHEIDIPPEIFPENLSSEDLAKFPKRIKSYLKKPQKPRR